MISDKQELLSELIEIAVVVKPHGVNGAVKLKVHNPDSTVLERCQKVWLVIGEQRHQIELCLLGAVGPFLLVHFPGVKDRQEAEQLRGARVLVARQDLEPLTEGEYLYVDLIGCEVFNEQGSCLGLVSHVFAAGASDILVIKQDGGELLIPLTEEWVDRVDIAGRQIHLIRADLWELT